MNKDQNKKIAFWGTPEMVTGFLDVLEQNNYTPCLIITGEDKKQGRGLVKKSPYPKDWGDKRGIKVLQPEKLDKEFFETFKEHNIDLSIVVAYGKIIKEEIINNPKKGTINIHYSLLPKHRGATPVEASILSGDKQTGVSIQQMVYKLDAGDILSQSIVNIDDTICKNELFELLNKNAQILLIETVDAIFLNKIKSTPQDESSKTMCGKIKKEDGEILLNQDHKNNWNKYRAYQGWPGVFTYVLKANSRTRMIIKKAIYENEQFIPVTVVFDGGKEMLYKDAEKIIKTI